MNKNGNKQGSLTAGLGKWYRKMSANKFYRICLILLGLPTFIVTLIKYLMTRGNDAYSQQRAKVVEDFTQNGKKAELKARIEASLRNKLDFFGKKMDKAAFDRSVEKTLAKQFGEMVDHELARRLVGQDCRPITVTECYCSLIENKLFLLFSIITSLPMYFLILIYSNAYAKYLFERLLMMVFVIFGVTFVVFTILHFSPSDPATNILGDLGTQEQREAFNKMYGLDQPYLVQLWNTFENVVTFDLGNTYLGNENVMEALTRKFPTTLSVALASLCIALSLSIIPGIISAMKQYSAFDYILMLVALLGLSIPNFWLGLMLILQLSIRMGVLPATYHAGELITILMPAIVIGTELSATIARMTRSSMLEVKRQDYILTARAKGLSNGAVTFRHILGNAMIPIVTAIGLQVGGLLGGSSVTEKVFTISGVGSYIVDKQFIPDIPAVLGGVIYIAIIISIVNLVVDILYSFLDPRIKSRLKSY